MRLVAVLHSINLPDTLHICWAIKSVGRVLPTRLLKHAKQSLYDDNNDDK